MTSYTVSMVTIGCGRGSFKVSTGPLLSVDDDIVPYKPYVQWRSRELSHDHVTMVTGANSSGPGGPGTPGAPTTPHCPSAPCYHDYIITVTMTTGLPSGLLYHGHHDDLLCPVVLWVLHYQEGLDHQAVCNVL